MPGDVVCSNGTSMNLTVLGRNAGRSNALHRIVVGAPFFPRLLSVQSAIMRASPLFAAVGILIAAPACGHAQARPCTAPTTACERWVPLGGGSGKSMVYA